MSFLIVLVLLVLPIFAGHRLGGAIYWMAGYAGLVSAVTYAVYGMDKGRAEGGLGRIPEATLHLLELSGGWPGAFIAQRRLRHKCAKVGYQVVFWLIVLIYQLSALDSLQDWRFARAGWAWVARLLGQGD
jgi:uncharacterized membrane protein YsdA (DUF1294 family)